MENAIRVAENSILIVEHAVLTMENAIRIAAHPGANPYRDPQNHRFSGL